MCISDSERRGTAERSAGSAGRVQRRRVHCPPSFFFSFTSFSLTALCFPPAGGHARGQAMPHCRELALAQVWGLIHHRLRMPLPHLMRAVSRPISLLNQHPHSRHYPRLPPPPPLLHSPFGGLPLRCKVTDAFPHAIKKEKSKGPSQRRMDACASLAQIFESQLSGSPLVCCLPLQCNTGSF